MQNKKATPKSSPSTHAGNALTPKPPGKHELALMDLLEAGTTGISKLTELPSYGETSLPTTISELCCKRGFHLKRELRGHTHRHGGKTHFTWYWLADRGEACQAANLINKLRQQRGADPISELLAEKLVHALPLPDELGGVA